MNGQYQFFPKEKRVKVVNESFLEYFNFKSDQARLFKYKFRSFIYILYIIIFIIFFLLVLINLAENYFK
ncbi:MAG: hypothetical protein CMC41_08610 [Flavobacteriaceae bacterium]|nr:hypothetical protein [Flavobacteriaceae bacterium]